MIDLHAEILRRKLVEIGTHEAVIKLTLHLYRENHDLKDKLLKIKQLSKQIVEHQKREHDKTLL